MPIPTRRRAARSRSIGWGGVTTFNSLNNYILKGDAAQGLELLFNSLMMRAADEPDAVYGLVAESAEIAADGKSVTFHLRPEARFADGTPLTADDVVFSFDTLKTKGHPIFHQMLQDVVKAEALDPRHGALQLQRRARARPAAHRRRASDLLQDLLRDAAVRRDHARAAARLGSLRRRSAGARAQHRLSRAIRTIGRKDLPVNRGRWNFDKIRYEYFRDRTAGDGGVQGRRLRFPRGVHLEGLGDRVRLSRRSAPARSGRKCFPTRRPRARKASSSTRRRESLKDPRVRQGARPCLRFRVDQPQRVLWAL